LKKIKIKKLGIVAGSGELPGIAFQNALAQGVPVVVFLVAEENRLSAPVDYAGAEKVEFVSAGSFGKLLKLLKANQISHIILIGKIKKKLLFKNLLFDKITIKLLSQVKNWNDRNIFQSVAQEIEKVGVVLLSQGYFLNSLLLPPGIYSKKKPSSKDIENIAFGLYYARKIADLDIGQTVVVSQCSVIAVEGVEGTDQAIQRGGQLAGRNGAVVCKTQRKGQDLRFDIPTLGLNTLDAMHESGCNIIAMEAYRTFVVNPKKFIETVNKYGLIFCSSKVPANSNVDSKEFASHLKVDTSP
jgi:hypothetical protein